MITKFFKLFIRKERVFYNPLANRISNCGFCNVATGKTDKNIRYLLILDFEATCDKTKIVQEIIEFPCLKINLSNLKEEGRFHKYVRPIINPTLTNFCIELTGILQEMVDDEKPFPEVLGEFTEWRKMEGLTEDNSIYVTSGDWDLGHMMPNQCQISNINMPSHMTEWIDIKKFYINHSNHYVGSLIEIIKNLGLEFVGQAHSGIDDCLNIYNVIKKLASWGVKFKPTSKLRFSNVNREVVRYI